jgi:uncharacterized protein (DUF2147 family)
MLHCPRNITKTAILLSVILPTSFATALAADPTGDWRVADGVANIRVAQCGGNMWGVVAWEKEPGGRDKNNPDASLQSRPTLGMPILLDMKKKAGADSWEGQVYNAKDGQTYSSSITPVDADHLEIKGCVLGFLCGGETWTRVAPPIPSSPANSMAKGAAKPAPAAAKPAPAAAKPAAPKTAASAPAAAPAPGAPKSTSGTATASAKGRTQPADAVGDICLLPDIARFTH